MSPTSTTHWVQSPASPPDPLLLSVIQAFPGHVAASAEREGFFDYPFGLSATPDPKWIGAFTDAYRVLVEVSRREVRFEQSRLLVRVHPDDNKQRVFDAIRCAVEDANAGCADLRAAKLSEAPSREDDARRDAAVLARMKTEAAAIVITDGAPKHPAGPSVLGTIESAERPEGLHEVGVAGFTHHAPPQRADVVWALPDRDAAADRGTRGRLSRRSRG